MTSIHSPPLRGSPAVGIGTSGLHGGWARGSSLRLLEASYEHGIRHIDTAPLYGLGYAEEIVGRFLASHPRVTVTTKYGLFPPAQKYLWEAARFVARPLAARAPALKKLLLASLRMARSGAPAGAGARAGAAAGAGPSGLVFNSDAIRQGVENSLRALRRGHIDFFLLHEATPADLTDEVRTTLEHMVACGKIGTWGLASARDKLTPVFGRADTGIPVLQFGFPVDGGQLPASRGTVTITHGALSDSLRRLPLADPAFLGDFARAVDCDLSLPGAVARTIMSAALAANPGGMVLFSSTRVEHIAQLAEVIRSPAAAQRTGHRALEFLLRESRP